jgi:hypothetical protein
MAPISRLFALLLTVLVSLTAPARAQDLAPDEARAIAAEVWLYSYAPIQGYQTMYNQAVNSAFPGYVCVFHAMMGSHSTG